MTHWSHYLNKFSFEPPSSTKKDQKQNHTLQPTAPCHDSIMNKNKKIIPKPKPENKVNPKPIQQNKATPQPTPANSPKLFQRRMPVEKLKGLTGSSNTQPYYCLNDILLNKPPRSGFLCERNQNNKLFIKMPQ
jgi:hypothetical protein